MNRIKLAVPEEPNLPEDPEMMFKAMLPALPETDDELIERSSQQPT